MRHHKHIIYAVGILSVLLLLVSSCINEVGVEYGHCVEEDEVRIELFTNAHSYHLPTTRMGMADEYGVDPTPWVLVFEGTDGDALFVEAEQAFVSEGKSYVILKKNNNACRLLIIANPPELFSDSQYFNLMEFEKEILEALLYNATFDFAVGYLTTQQLEIPEESVPYASESTPYPQIPMSAVVSVNNINSQTKIGSAENKIALKQIVAKVTVEDRSSQIHLLGAAPVNVARAATFYRENTTPPTTIGGTTDYVAEGDYDEYISGISPAMENNTFEHPLYIYESAANDATSIIIIAYHNDNETFYYYRLTFSDHTGNIPVERNKEYKFVINNIEGAGYDTWEEAKAAPPTNIDYTTSVTDDSSVDIINSGEYYLGVTNSEVWIYSNAGVDQPFEAFRIITNATSEMVDATNLISDSIANNGSGLSLHTTQVALPTTAGDITVTPVYISLTGNFTTLSEGFITVRVGRIEKEIAIRRINQVPAQANVVAFADEFFRGEIISRNPSAPPSWVVLSDHPDSGIGYRGDIVVAHEEDGIYAHFTAKESTERVVEIYLSRRANIHKGRVKAVMKQ